MAARVSRSGPGSLAGQAFYDVEHLRTYSFCPDSNDASTPATQVHVAIQLKGELDLYGFRQLPPAPMVMRFRGPVTLDAFIEALIEHRTYVFGRRLFDAPKYPSSSGEPAGPRS